MDDWLFIKWRPRFEYCWDVCFRLFLLCWRWFLKLLLGKATISRLATAAWPCFKEFNKSWGPFDGWLRCCGRRIWLHVAIVTFDKEIFAIGPGLIDMLDLRWFMKRRRILSLGDKCKGIFINSWMIVYTLLDSIWIDTCQILYRKGSFFYRSDILYVFRLGFFSSYQLVEAILHYLHFWMQFLPDEGVDYGVFAVGVHPFYWLYYP